MWIMTMRERAKSTISAKHHIGLSLALLLYLVLSTQVLAKQPILDPAPLIPLESRIIHDRRWVSVPSVPVQDGDLVRYELPNGWRYFYDRNGFYEPTFYRAPFETGDTDFFDAKETVTLEDAVRIKGLPW